MVAATAPPSPAAFLYVPPEGAAAKATPGAGADAGSTAAGAGGREPALAEGSPLWSVRAEETLRAALGRWGEEAGVEVMFLTDRRYRLHEARAFEGSFEDATRALFSALSHLPHPPVGALRPGGRTLEVLHRAHAAGHGR